MSRSITLIPRQPEQAIVLACVEGGRHIQVGAPSNREGAHALFTVLDDELNGYGRNERGRYVRTGSGRPHRIDGRQVKFYRVREGSHEFGTIDTVPVNRVARKAR